MLVYPSLLTKKRNYPSVTTTPQTPLLFIITTLSQSPQSFIHYYTAITIYSSSQSPFSSFHYHTAITTRQSSPNHTHHNHHTHLFLSVITTQLFPQSPQLFTTSTTLIHSLPHRSHHTTLATITTAIHHKRHNHHTTPISSLPRQNYHNHHTHPFITTLHSPQLIHPPQLSTTSTTAQPSPNHTYHNHPPTTLTTLHSPQSPQLSTTSTTLHAASSKS